LLIRAVFFQKLLCGLFCSVLLCSALARHRDARVAVTVTSPMTKTAQLKKFSVFPGEKSLAGFLEEKTFGLIFF
jgi:hypothetical protein